MTHEKVIQDAEYYATLLRNKGIEPKRMDTRSYKTLRNKDILCHASSLVLNTPMYVRNGTIKKTMRHLGFVQASLRVAGLANLEDLMHHNRPQT